MKFSKNVLPSIFINNISRGKPPKSNQKTKSFYVSREQKHQKEQQKNVAEQAKLVAVDKYASYNVIFKRGMDERSVRRMMFIMEGEDNFELRSLRSKMTEVIKKSSKNLQDDFYEKGVDGKLPENWEAFKVYVEEYCTEQSISSLKKYINESWAEYISRMYDWARLRNLSENDVIDKLRKEKIPQMLQTMCYMPNISLNTILERTKEFEKQSKRFSKKENRNLKNTKNENKDINYDDKKCFICKKSGHMSKDCRNRKTKCYKCGKNGHYSNECDGSVNNVLVEEYIDTRNIRIQNKNFMTIFDTGASDNMMCSGVLKQLKKINVLPTKKTYKCFDGSKNTTEGTAEIEFEYDGRVFKEQFNIVKNDKEENILLSNNFVKSLEKKIKAIPMECRIDTQGKGPVSWSRPIRSQKDKKDFDYLLTKLESKGIIEPSTS